MRNDILTYIRMLNRYDILPEHSLRRNSVYYKYVTYVNHTIALFICENYTDTVLFVYRAKKELKYLKDNSFNKEVYNSYFDICEDYFKLLIKFIEDLNLVDEKMLELLR